MCHFDKLKFPATVEGAGTEVTIILPRQLSLHSKTQQ